MTGIRNWRIKDENARTGLKLLDVFCVVQMETRDSDKVVEEKCFHESLLEEKSLIFLRATLVALPVGPPTNWLLYSLIWGLLTSCPVSQQPCTLGPCDIHWPASVRRWGLLCLICMRLPCQVQMDTLCQLHYEGSKAYPVWITNWEINPDSVPAGNQAGSVHWHNSFWDPQRHLYMKEKKPKFLLLFVKETLEERKLMILSV